MRGVDLRELRASGGFGSAQRDASSEASTTFAAASSLLRAQTACTDAPWHAGLGVDAPQPAGGAYVTP